MKALTNIFEEIKGSTKKYTFKTYKDKRKITVTHKKPIPSYTRTDDQDIQRRKFEYAILEWHELTEQEKKNFNEMGRKQEPPLTGYQYFIKQKLLRKKFWYRVTIDNTSNDLALEEYQVMIKIYYDGAFFTRCERRKESIRILDSDMKTHLTYAVTEWNTSNKNAQIWVNVPFIERNSTKHIYISVDPSRQEDMSDFANTFFMKWAENYSLTEPFFDVIESPFTKTTENSLSPPYSCYCPMGTAPIPNRFIRRSQPLPIIGEKFTVYNALNLTTAYAEDIAYIFAFRDERNRIFVGPLVALYSGGLYYWDRGWVKTFYTPPTNKWVMYRAHIDIENQMYSVDVSINTGLTWTRKINNAPFIEQMRREDRVIFIGGGVMSNARDGYYSKRYYDNYFVTKNADIPLSVEYEEI